MLAAIAIFMIIIWPNMDSVINPTSVSRNHISVGPVIMTTPTDMVNAMENLGIITRLIFSLAVPPR